MANNSYPKEKEKILTELNLATQKIWEFYCKKLRYDKWSTVIKQFYNTHGLKIILKSHLIRPKSLK